MSIRAAILSVSDSRTPAEDVSGHRLGELLEAMGAEIVDYRMTTDEPEEIRHALTEMCERDDIDLVLTTGGTGFGPRDNTPEATLAVIQRMAPGLAEAMRRETSVKTPMAMLSRGIAGIRGTTLIINLPGSTKAVEECFEVIAPVLKHAVSLVGGHTTH